MTNDPIVALDIESRDLVYATASISLPVHAIQKLIENSIDAGASSISVETDMHSGGLLRLSVQDNGHGIVNWHQYLGIRNNITLRVMPDTSRPQYTPHGYRGASLFTIAKTVDGIHGKMLITSKRELDKFAKQWQVGAFQTTYNDRCLFSHVHGTSVCVENMFKSIYPVRHCYLSSQNAKLVSDTVKLVMAYSFTRPDIHFRIRLVNKDGHSKIIATNPKKKTLLSVLQAFGNHTCGSSFESSYTNPNIYTINVITASVLGRTLQKTQLVCLNNKPMKDSCRFHQLVRRAATCLGQMKVSWVVSVTNMSFEMCDLDAWRRQEAVFPSEHFESGLAAAIGLLFEKHRAVSDGGIDVSNDASKSMTDHNIIGSIIDSQDIIRRENTHHLNASESGSSPFRSTFDKENLSVSTSADTLSKSFRKQSASTANTTFEPDPQSDLRSKGKPVPLFGVTKPHLRTLKPVKPPNSKFSKRPLSYRSRTHDTRKLGLTKVTDTTHARIVATNTQLAMPASAFVAAKFYTAGISSGNPEYADYFEETSLPVHTERTIVSSHRIQPRVSRAVIIGRSDIGIFRFFDAEKITTRPGDFGVLLVQFRTYKRDHEP